jgi:hypothetical protein
VHSLLPPLLLLLLLLLLVVCFAVMSVAGARADL